MKEINIRESRATTRMGHLPVSGGGLNASYICTTAGNLGLKYVKDFIWSSQGYTDDMEECVTLLVKEEKYETFLQLALQNDHKIKHTNDGDVKLIKERR